MRSIFKSRLAMFRRVRDLLATGPDVPGLAAPRAELDKVIDRLSTHAVNQDEHDRAVRSITITLQTQARDLRRHLMRPIALATRMFPKLSPDEAGALRTAVRMPHRRTDYEGLIIAARGMAATAEQHRERFIAAGLDPDFATRLQREADALVAAIGQRSQERQRRVASTQGVDAEVTHGANVVRFIDALLQPTLATDPVRAAEWRSALRWSRPGPAAAEPAVEVPPVPQQQAA